MLSLQRKICRLFPGTLQFLREGSGWSESSTMMSSSTPRKVPFLRSWAQVYFLRGKRGLNHLLFGSGSSSVAASVNNASLRCSHIALAEGRGGLHLLILPSSSFPFDSSDTPLHLFVSAKSPSVAFIHAYLSLDFHSLGPLLWPLAILVLVFCPHWCFSTFSRHHHILSDFSVSAHGLMEFYSALEVFFPGLLLGNLELP